VYSVEVHPSTLVGFLNQMRGEYSLAFVFIEEYVPEIFANNGICE
jgi:hypothetical protein